MAKSIGSAGAAKATGGAATLESVADIIERELQAIVVDWHSRVEEKPGLKSIPLSFDERTGHLPDDVTIADEADAQLKEQMLRFMAGDAANLAKGK